MKKTYLFTRSATPQLTMVVECVIILGLLIQVVFDVKRRRCAIFMVSTDTDSDLHTVQTRYMKFRVLCIVFAKCR